MVHLAYIEDSFYIKDRGQVVTFSKPYGFSAVPGDAITFFSPDGRAVITTIIHAVEMFARAIEYPSDPIGLLLKGFSQKVVMNGWMAAVHAKG